MRWLARFLKFAFFAIFVLPLIDKTLGGQQGAKPILTEVSTQNDSPLDPTLDWISEYRAPLIYYVWWQEVALCEGLPFPIDSVRKVQYFQVNGPDFIPLDVDAIVYAVTYWNDQTYIAYPYIWNKALVEHEALHLLLKWSGDRSWYEHDPARFNSCGLSVSGPPAPNR